MICYTELNTNIVMVKKEYKSELIRFAEYMVSGGAWFWSGYLIIIALDDLIPLFWANLIGNAVGISINYILNRYWVFKSSSKKPTNQLATRYVVYTVLNAFILNYAILLILRRNGIEPEIGQFIASGFFTVWNYFWYKYYVFADKGSK